VGETDVRLRAELPARFPLKLPVVSLMPWDALGFIPHLETGSVCYTDPEGLVWDASRPADAVEEALRRAITVLEDGVSGRNSADFTSEFEAHWIRLKRCEHVLSVLEPADEVRAVIMASQPGEVPWVATSIEDLAAYRNGAPAAKKPSIRNVLFLPLRRDTRLIPPRPDGPCWTPEQARQRLLPALTDADRRRLKKLIRRSTRTYEFVIVQLPRPEGGESMFGLRFEHVGKLHPLLPGGTAMHVIPLRVDRRDKAYLVERGGGRPSLAGKRALVIGCGAVGGHIPGQLARAGVLDLTLVDHESLTPDNTFRHRLGRKCWGMNKAQALKTELEGQLVYLRVRAVPDQIESAIAAGKVRLQEFDVVVVALGKPTVELWLNEQLVDLVNGPAVVFAWVEPLGIGGHALLVTDASQCGCFACLYTSAEDEPLINRAAFAAPGQRFGKALTGCGSLHTPYGALDAERTALLASELAVEYLAGDERQGTLASWRGDATAFAQQYSLAPRFGSTDEQLNEQRHQFRHPSCPVCSQKAVAA